MTTVSATSRVVTMADVNVGLDATPLSPAAIMLMLRRRLADLDGQIQGMMHDIETSTSRSEAVQAITEGVQLIRAAHAAERKSAENFETLDELQVEWEGRRMSAAELLNELGITDLEMKNGAVEDIMEPRAARIEHHEEEIEALEAYLEGDDVSDAGRAFAERGIVQHREAIAGIEAEPVYTGEMKVNGTTLDSYIQQLQSRSRRANSNNEIMMAQMQSGVQQRSQAITMATQMMKNVTESMREVARNLG